MEGNCVRGLNRILTVATACSILGVIIYSSGAFAAPVGQAGD